MRFMKLKVFVAPGEEPGERYINILHIESFDEHDFTMTNGDFFHFVPGESERLKKVLEEVSVLT